MIPTFYVQNVAQCAEVCNDFLDCVAFLIVTGNHMTVSVKMSVSDWPLYVLAPGTISYGAK